MTNLEIQSAYIGEDQADKIYLGEDLVWSRTPSYLETPLTFEIISGGTIVWRTSQNVAAARRVIEYSLDNGSTWTQILSSSAGTAIQVSAGDKVMFRGDNSTYAISSDACSCFSGGTATFNAYGNIMSLINSTDFETLSGFTATRAVARLFCYSNIVDASNLMLPATTLSYECYMYMFVGCSSLTAAPALPATTLTDFCYQFMFSGCTSLTTAPDLPATTLSEACYGGMFRNCTSLNYVKCLAIYATGSTTSWITNAASAGTFVTACGQQGAWPSGTSGIPEGWTIQGDEGCSISSGQEEVSGDTGYEEIEW